MLFYPGSGPGTTQLCKFGSILEIDQFKVKTDARTPVEGFCSQFEFAAD